MRRSFGLCLATLFLTLPSAAFAQAGDPNLVIAPPSDEITLRGGKPVLLPCFKRPGDPLDAISAHGSMMQQMVVPVGPLRGKLRHDSDPVLGAGNWQRAGTDMGHYVFRVPLDGSPMCIGSDAAPWRSWGQLRTVIDARPLWGKYVRFVGFIATRPSDEAKVWLAAGTSAMILQGDKAGSKPVTGTGRWEPFAVTMGPIRGGATKISYGFLLSGKGDMWITSVDLQVFDKRPPTIGKTTI